MLLDDYDHAQNQINRLENSIASIVGEHYAHVAECLDSISGIGTRSAEIILSEAGDDMSRSRAPIISLHGAESHPEITKVRVNERALPSKKATYIYGLR